MEAIDFAKQMIEYQKTAFNSGFNIISKIQDQAETTTSMFLEKTWGLPKDSQKIFSQWSEIFRKGRDDLKHTVEQNFGTIENLFAHEASTKKAK